MAWADFHIPEPDHRQKIIVDDDGRVYGHLAIWNEPHEGFPNRLRYPPRPGDGYASFNQPGPLTEHGQVETGPIFLLGGHPDQPLGNGDPYKAYGGVENCWADVRVTAGVHGPWLSGRVRPGVDDNMLYAARPRGFPGIGSATGCGRSRRATSRASLSAVRALSEKRSIRDGEVLELVASYQGDDEPGLGDSPILWSQIDQLAEALADTPRDVTETIDGTSEVGETWSAEEVAEIVVARLNETRFSTMSGTLSLMEPPATFVNTTNAAVVDDGRLPARRDESHPQTLHVDDGHGVGCRRPTRNGSPRRCRRPPPTGSTPGSTAPPRRTANPQNRRQAPSPPSVRRREPRARRTPTPWPQRWPRCTAEEAASTSPTPTGRRCTPIWPPIIGLPGWNHPELSDVDKVIGGGSAADGAWPHRLNTRASVV